MSDRYQDVVERIRTAAQGREVTLIAVSKTHPAEAIEELYRLGHRDFGENYAQELSEKARALAERGCSEIRWHFIGHLQSNKAKLVTPYAHAVHSIDSMRLARELAKRWEQADRAGKLSVFIEVNIDMENSKSGLSPKEAQPLAEEIASLSVLELQGLMAIPSPSQTDAGEPFAKLRELEKSCRPFTRGGLSMGMTQDFETAIREGATHLRIGTAIFGERPKQVADPSDEVGSSSLS